MAKHKMTKACEIPKAVKEEVYERDGRCCVICGSNQGLPEAHIVPRSQGGLGVAQNIVTLCRRCHRDYDGERRSAYGFLLRSYIKRFYKNWTPESVTYRKFDLQPSSQPVSEHDGTNTQPTEKSAQEA